MGRTLTQIRQLTAQQLGLLYISGTSDSGGSTTTLKDSILQVYPNDRLNGYHILLTSGSPSETELQITDFVSSTGVATVTPTLSAAPDALTYEVLPFSGTEFLRGIQDAALELYDRGLLLRQFWVRMMAGSPLYNADWSYWTSATAVDGWTAVGTIGREQSTANSLDSENALSISAGGSLTLDQYWERFLHDFRNQTVTFCCPVRTNATSNARLNLITGSTNNYSTYHGGSNQIELLSVEVAIPDNVSRIRPQLLQDATGAAYFGMPFFIPPEGVVEYPFPVNIMPDGPRELLIGSPEIQLNQIASGRSKMNILQLGSKRSALRFAFRKYHQDDSTKSYGVLSLDRGPLRDVNLIAVGDGPLTIPATATATTTMEVSYSESLLLATLAAIKLLERSAMRYPRSSQDQLRERIAFLTRQFRDLEGGVGQTRNAATLPMRW